MYYVGTIDFPPGVPMPFTYMSSSGYPYWEIIYNSGSYGSATYRITPVINGTNITRFTTYAYGLGSNGSFTFNSVNYDSSGLIASFTIRTDGDRCSFNKDSKISSSEKITVKLSGTMRIYLSASTAVNVSL